MAFSKARLYDEQAQLTANYFDAFSHPARLRIFMQLSQNGPSCVEFLAEEHPVNESTFCDHLKKLRIPGLVAFREKYPYIIYSIDEVELEMAERLILNFFETIRENNRKRLESAVMISSISKSKKV